MALTTGDKKWIKEAITGSLIEFHHQVTEPLFNQVFGDMKEMKNDMIEMKNDMIEMKNDMANMSRRMDRLSEVVTDTRTDHEKRIRRLEDEAGIEPNPVNL